MASLKEKKRLVVVCWTPHSLLISLRYIMKERLVKPLERTSFLAKEKLNRKLWYKTRLKIILILLLLMIYFHTIRIWMRLLIREIRGKRDYSWLIQSKQTLQQWIHHMRVRLKSRRKVLRKGSLNWWNSTYRMISKRLSGICKSLTDL